MKREFNKTWTFSDLNSSHFECPINNLNKMTSIAYVHRNCAVPLHSHDFFEINIVLAGSGKHAFYGNEYDLISGNIFVIPPSYKHAYINEGGLEIFHLLLSGAFFHKYSAELKQLTNFISLFEIEPSIRKNNNTTLHLCITGQDKKTLFQMLNQLVTFQSLSYSENHVICEYLVVSIIGLLCSSFEQLKNQPTLISGHHKGANIIFNCMEFLQNNCHEKIEVNDLATKYHLSRSTLLRYFEDITKTTPSKYLLTCRLNKAKILLESTVLSVATVAQECGFFDSTHLTKFFKDSLHMTPLQYRRMYTEKEKQQHQQ